MAQYPKKDKQINGICEGKDGDIMMGTEKGLYLFDRKKNKVVDFPHAEALTGKQTCGIG